MLWIIAFFGSNLILYLNSKSLFAALSLCGSEKYKHFRIKLGGQVKIFSKLNLKSLSQQNCILIDNIKKIHS